MHFLFGLFIMFVGALIVVKSEWFLNNFGRIEFFERHLGAEGGSRLGYKFLGLIVVFFGILIFTNMIGGFLEWMLSPLIRYSNNLE